MTSLRRQLLAPIALFLLSIALIAQPPQENSLASQASQSAPERTKDQRDTYRKAMEDADQKIAAEVTAHSELMKNLEYLTTQIGARLTGSPEMQQASEWTLKRFRDYGVDANLETAEVPHGWTRGLETAEITSPIQKRISIHALAWTPGTDGDVSGEDML